MNTPAPSCAAIGSGTLFRPCFHGSFCQTRFQAASLPLAPRGTASAFAPGFATGPHAPAYAYMARAPGPPRHRPQLFAASLLTCVALLFLPKFWSTPLLQCQSSMPCNALLLLPSNVPCRADFSSLHVELVAMTVASAISISPFLRHVDASLSGVSIQSLNIRRLPMSPHDIT